MGISPYRAAVRAFGGGGFKRHRLFHASASVKAEGAASTAVNTDTTSDRCCSPLPCLSLGGGGLIGWSAIENSCRF